MLRDPTDAEISAIVLAVTAAVVIVKATAFCPAGIVTVAGTLADAELLERVTINPPAGAGPSNRIKPVEVLPPLTCEG